MLSVLSCMYLMQISNQVLAHILRHLFYVGTYTIIYMFANELETDRMIVNTISKKIGIINNELNDTIDFAIGSLENKLAQLKKLAIEKGL